MDGIEVLVDAFGRVSDVVHSAVDGLSVDTLTWRPDESANSIGWLVWHLSRIQDDHVAGVAGTEQVYESKGFATRFDLPFGDDDTGYGHSPDDVAAVRADSALLTEYFESVHARTLQYLAGLRDSDLARVVDEAWDPPVTLAVRLVSVISDDLQHAGQAGYLRGLANRR